MCFQILVQASQAALEALDNRYNDGSDYQAMVLPCGDAPDFVEVGEAGIAMDDAMRRQRRVQLVG